MSADNRITRGLVGVTALLALASSTTLPAWAAPGDIFYVHGDHPNASDDNDGRALDRPWRTIIKAATTLRAGETARVRALAGVGYYRELGVQDPSLAGRSGVLLQFSGAAGSPITIEAYPGERPVLDQGMLARGFQIENARYVTIRGIEIRNAHVAGVWARYGFDNRFISVENSYIHDVEGPAGSNVGGIRFDGEPACEGCVARNNVIGGVRLAGDPQNMNAAAIHSFGINNGILENNELYDSPAGFFHKGEAANSSATTIRRNVIHDVNHGVRISTQSSRPQRGYRIYENVMYNVTGAGVYTPLDYGNADLHLYNNVIEGSNVGVVLYNFSDIRLWNNIFLLPSANNVIQINASGAPTQLTYSNYNLFGQSQTCVLDEFGPNPRRYTTLASWQSGTNFDRESLAGSPAFVNRNARDYHLAAGSLGLGSGQNGENMGAYRTGTEVIGPGARARPRAPTLSVQ